MKAVQWGLEHEKTAIQELTNENDNFFICDVGLFQHSEHPNLAATPDGLIHDKTKPEGNQWGVLGVKCPLVCKNLPAQSDIKTVISAAKLKKLDYLRQLQGQMACVGVKWGLLVIWTPNKLYTEEVQFDQDLWAAHMDKLNKFWWFALAPEIEDSRVVRGQPIRPWKFEYLLAQKQ